VFWPKERPFTIHRCADFLDEPASGLDPRAGRVKALLKELRRLAKTICISIQFHRNGRLFARDGIIERGPIALSGPMSRLVSGNLRPATGCGDRFTGEAGGWTSILRTARRCGYWNTPDPRDRRTRDGRRGVGSVEMELLEMAAGVKDAFFQRRIRRLE